MSMSTLNRRLDSYGLRRRNPSQIDEIEVKGIIEKELEGPSSLSGYRAMWHTLRLKYGLCLPRAKVETLLKELDSAGVEERRRHRLKRRIYASSGPNQIWHVDGYDKLKPFGFPVHAAIDGYCRRVLWIKVTPTNNDPAVIAGFFLECVQELQGCPILLRTDPGTDTGTMAIIQCHLRSHHNDELAGDRAHRYGPSTGNQRIECWWSHLTRWINFFKDLSDRGI